ncbi:IS607 family transposase, partial [Thioclava sp. NG1]
MLFASCIIFMMKKFVSIGEAAKALGVTPLTLRRWDESGKLKPDLVTEGGRRRYDLAKLQPELHRQQDKAARRTVAYARVS